jgi:hypothetical protein
MDIFIVQNLYGFVSKAYLYGNEQTIQSYTDLYETCMEPIQERFLYRFYTGSIQTYIGCSFVMKAHNLTLEYTSHSTRISYAALCR